MFRPRQEVFSFALVVNDFWIDATLRCFSLFLKTDSSGPKNIFRSNINAIIKGDLLSNGPLDTYQTVLIEHFRFLCHSLSCLLKNGSEFVPTLEKEILSDPAFLKKRELR